MEMSDCDLLHAVKEMEGLLYTTQFGRYDVRVKTAECVQLIDTWTNRKVLILMDRLLQSDLQEIYQAITWVECNMAVDQEWFIGVNAKVKSPVPFVDVQGIRMDRSAWEKWMEICSELKQQFPPVKNRHCMSDVHQEMLRKNHVFMLQNLDLCSKLLSWLVSQRVLSYTMVEELESVAYPTTASKISLLLRMLPRRGANAFRLFIEGLVITEQPHVVNKLLSQ